MNYSTQTLIQAAMFAALGTLTKMSRSGNSIVFIRPVLGRSDLSGDDELAQAQAQAAGLTVDSVTEPQVMAWRTWYADMREARRVAYMNIVAAGMAVFAAALALWASL